MRLEEARLRVGEALRDRDCVAREEEEYGPEYERVTYMEYESPAPDPCAEALIRLLEAVRACERAGGNREELDLSEARERVYEALDRG